MAIIEGWFPPSRENYTFITNFFQIAYPIVSAWALSLACPIECRS